MDLEPLRQIAAGNVPEYGLTDRVSTITGNMFKDSWSTDHGAILLGTIFHDWDVEFCQRLAQSVYDALPPGGTILLHEILLDEDKSGPLMAANFSVTMLVYEKGKQYTFTEFKNMPEKVGLKDCKVTNAFGYYSLVSATK